MDYQSAVEYLLSFADFERSGRFQDRPDVAPVLSLLGRLGDPHLGARPGERLTVHIAGSKGKGSVAAMVESMLRAGAQTGPDGPPSGGARTGLYTSPHLHSFCERVRIDGAAIAEEEFARLTAALRPAADAERDARADRQLVTFDLLTALAFLAFREHGVRAQVVEVGLGGRLDSTNVFETKEAAVITPISLEHTAVLGGTIELIAREKAAIIRPGGAVVLAPQAHGEAARVVEEFAAAAGAPVVDVARRYRWRRLGHDLRGQEIRVEGPGGAVEARLPLLGEHQVENAATALACIDALRGRGLAVPPQAAAAGLAGLSWPGRLEVLRERPLVVADGAHNRDSARRLREALTDYLSCAGAFLIVGTSADKDVRGIAQELAPLARGAFAVEARHPRAMAPERIAAALAEAGIEARVAGSVAAALDRAMAEVGPRGVICAVGSLFVVAEAREHLLGTAARANG